MEHSTISIDLEVYRAIESRRTSFTQTTNDILRDFLLSSVSENRANLPSERTPNAQTRLYRAWIGNDDFTTTYARDAYSWLLKRLNDKDRNFLDRLSEIETPGRRIVSKNPERLYKNTPHLAEDFAKPLIDDWWFDTNLSVQQIKSRLSTASKLAGYSYGDNLGLDEKTI